MNLLIADTRKDVGRGHRSRISALHHALGGHIVEMDDSVPCGIRLDGELICSGLEYALIRPEVVALRPEKPKPWWPDGEPPWREFHHLDKGAGYLQRMVAADFAVVRPGVTALEVCCLGIPLNLQNWSGDQQLQHHALMALSHTERFRVIDGKGAYRVAEAIKKALQIAPGDENSP